ncbi:MAG: DUF2027 domain-containing protein [Marinifilaceae bacterium]|jgi:hypothetical protein|nr:DUF2027 domain-containing protein [Marinifilaceae bacterium]
MNIKIGDEVRFLNDVGGGRVVEIIDSNTVLVLNPDDDFEIPCLAKNLVVTKQAENSRAQEEEIIQEKFEHKLSSGKKIESLFADKTDVLAVFVPNSEENYLDSDMKLYLVNNTKYNILFSFYHNTGAGLKGIKQGKLESKSKIELSGYSRSEIGDIKNCLFQVIFYQDGLNNPLKPFERLLKINPVKFRKESSYMETAYFRQPAVAFKLNNDALEASIENMSDKEFKNIIREKSKIVQKQQIKQNENEILEIDLHINELIDSVVGMSNADILEYQLSKFHEVMRENHSKKGKKIVFIHGIGNGTLKKKIYEELKRKYSKLYFQDASFKEYGWGATMITM